MNVNVHVSKANDVGTWNVAQGICALPGMHK